MPRGLPDYYNPDTLVSQRLANVEEVVTAVQKFANLDNRGRTLFFDPFNEDMSGWVSDTDGDGAVAVISAVEALIPPASALLDAGTSGNTGESQIVKRVHLGASALLGFEASFWYHEDAPRLRLDMRYDLAGDEFIARLEVLPSSGVMRIWTTTGNVTVGNVGYLASGDGSWLPFKLVADFSSGAYMRVVVGQEQIDLSPYAMVSSVLALPGRAEFRLHGFAVNAVTNFAYIGHATGTVDEP